MPPGRDPEFERIVSTSPHRAPLGRPRPRGDVRRLLHPFAPRRIVAWPGGPPRLAPGLEYLRDRLGVRLFNTPWTYRERFSLSAGFHRATSLGDGAFATGPLCGPIPAPGMSSRMPQSL